MVLLFIYAFLISISTLIVVIWASHKYQLFIDHSDEDKPQNFHDNSTPRAGGIGILLGMGMLLFFPLGIKFIISILLAFMSGIIEDFHHTISPKFRLFLQFITALSAVLISQTVVTYLGLGITMPYWAGVIFSIFAIVGMMNAINIIDGFNGLASGLILLILISFGFVSYTHQNDELLQIIMITMGGTFGVFVLNFPKGKIFLGDGGAYLLGSIIAIIGIYLASIYENVSPWYIFAIFIYPVWEVIFSIIRKLSMRRSPLKPDGYHFHMLVHHHIAKNNPLTAVLILLFLLPFLVTSTIYSNNSMMNIKIAFVFIVLYLCIYSYLYNKEKNKG